MSEWAAAVHHCQERPGVSEKTMISVDGELLSEFSIPHGHFLHIMDIDIAPMKACSSIHMFDGCRSLFSESIFPECRVQRKGPYGQPVFVVMEMLSIEICLTAQEEARIILRGVIHNGET